VSDRDEIRVDTESLIVSYADDHISEYRMILLSWQVSVSSRITSSVFMRGTSKCAIEFRVSTQVSQMNLQKFYLLHFLSAKNSNTLRIRTV